KGMKYLATCAKARSYSAAARRSKTSSSMLDPRNRFADERFAEPVRDGKRLRPTPNPFRPRSWPGFHCKSLSQSAQGSHLSLWERSREARVRAASRRTAALTPTLSRGRGSFAPQAIHSIRGSMRNLNAHASSYAKRLQSMLMVAQRHAVGCCRKPTLQKVSLWPLNVSNKSSVRGFQMRTGLSRKEPVARREPSGLKRAPGRSAGQAQEPGTCRELACQHSLFPLRRLPLLRQLGAP